MTVDAMVAEFRPMLNQLSAPDCALLIWGTSPKLPELLSLGQGWGFEFVTKLFCWVKMIEGWEPGQIRFRTPDLDRETFCGMGFYSRSSTEDLWLWRRGKPPLPEDRAIRQTIHAAPDVASPDALHAARREHSRKPDESYRRIEALWPEARRLEMFARQRRPGWDCWGNETGKFGGAT
jgi:N6-adenosine-specific RNA methylase IME4